MAPCGPLKSHKLLFMKEMFVGAVGIEPTSEDWEARNPNKNIGLRFRMASEWWFASLMHLC